MYDSLNIDLLYVFVTVAETKSINQSSKILLLSQPAISKKLKQLEEHFDKTLLLRSSRGVSLTPIGELFYLKTKKLLEDFNSLALIESPTSKERFSELNIGALDSIASLLYSSFFIEALSTAKRVSLTNKVSELINDFNHGDLDLIFIDEFFESKLTLNFEKYFLQAEPYYVVYSKNNTLLTKLDAQKITPDILRSCELILYPDYCPIHICIKQIFQKFKLKLPQIHEAEFAESTAALVANSDLVTILPRSLAYARSANPNLNIAIKELAIPELRKTAIFSNGKIPLEFIINKL